VVPCVSVYTPWNMISVPVVSYVWMKTVREEGTLFYNNFDSKPFCRTLKRSKDVCCALPAEVPHLDNSL